MVVVRTKIVSHAPEYHAEKAIEITVANSSGNRRFVNVTPISTLVPTLASGRRCIIRKCIFTLWKGTNNVNWGRYGFLLVTANAGSTFSDADYPKADDFQSDLVQSVSGNFTYKVLTPEVNVVPGQVIGYDGAAAPVRSEPYFELKGQKTINLTAICKKTAEGLYGMKPDELPVSWLVMYSKQKGVISTLFEGNVITEWDEQAQKPTVSF